MGQPYFDMALLSPAHKINDVGNGKHHDIVFYSLQKNFFLIHFESVVDFLTIYPNFRLKY